MDYEDHEEASKNQEGTEFVDRHKRNKNIEKIPKEDNPRDQKKPLSMIFVVFVLSITFPGFGLLLYIIWRKDEALLARASLIGFFLNLLFIAITLMSSFDY